MVAATIRWILGCSWIVLGVLKLIDEGRATVLESTLLAPVAAPFAVTLAVVEIVVGILLFTRRWARAAILTSVVLLFAYGAWALATPGVACNCAGRVAALSPLLHSLLTCAMLGLSGAALLCGGQRLSQATIQRTIFACFGAAAVAVGLALAGNPHAAIARVIAVTEIRDVPTGAESDRSEPPRLAGRPATPTAPPPAAPKNANERLLLHGRLLSRRGEAVAGGHLWLSSAGLGIAPVRKDQQVAVSREDGAFELDGSDSGDKSYLCASAEGFLPLCAHMAEQRTAEGTYEVVLDRGMSVRGRVVDELDRPVPGASVEAWGVHGEDLFPGRVFGPAAIPEKATATSDAAGSFDLAGLFPTRYRLGASATGHLSVRPRANGPEVDLADAMEPAEPIVLRLRRRFLAHVLAVDAATQEPIPLAHFSFNTRQRPWRPSAEVPPKSYRPSGSFHCSDGQALHFVWRDSSEPGQLEVLDVIANAPGYGRAVAAVRPVLCGSGEQLTYRIPLRALEEGSGTIDFVAEWPDGRPFAGPLRVMVADAKRTHKLDGSFADGHCGQGLRLPVGRYHAWLVGLQGSTVCWGQAAAAKRPFEVAEGEESVVVFSLRGGRLCIRPRTTTGGMIPEFSFTAGPVGSLASASEAYAYERERGGLVLYLPPGKQTIGVHKWGFASVKTSLDFPADGSMIEWEPVLTRRSTRAEK